jgi:glycogen debranching enzyme
VSEPSPYAGTIPSPSLTDRGAQVTLVEGQTFALSDRAGNMAPDLPQGLFVLDTRVLSRWELRVNGHGLEALTVESHEPYETTFVARAASPDRTGHHIVVFRRRHVGGGMREQVEIINYGPDETDVLVEVIVDVDFAGLFEVKESRAGEGRARSHRVEEALLRFGDCHGPAGKETTVELSGADAIEPGRALWRMTLPPGGRWETCIGLTVTVDGERLEPRFTCGGHDDAALPVERQRRWRAKVPDVATDHPGLQRALERSGADLGALRIFDPEHPDLAVIAAGAPWFMTVFGRDSLLTGWMTLLADHTLARGVLETLARFQGGDVVDVTEEEPGKILHEMRFAGAGGTSLGRGDVYYGSIDATPLFVMLLGELRRWDPSDGLVDRLLPSADRALDWIEDFGDRDGDGYVEYERRTGHGLANQGWKDSWDAVRHPDGTLARGPIALCEVQGYVHAAYVARAHLALEAGDQATFHRYRDKADDLHRRFNEDFWLDELGTYALGLDGDKRPVAAAASNVGHCLWTGIVDPERAGAVADRLLGDDLFSGWGVRTLGTSMVAYDPVSYHNGSVWPHDNAICAAGLVRYGFTDHAHRIITGQLDLAATTGGRLPELFAGFSRQELGVPAAYPASCSPQAWAAASPLLWLRSILRLDPWASRNQLRLAPRLPPGIRRLHIDGIAVGDATVTIDVDGDDVEVHGAGDLEVLAEPHPPLSTLLG